MKRRYYKIHHYNHAQPMKRVKHRRVNWPHVLLAVLALALIAVGVLAVLKWISLGRAKRPAQAKAEPTAIPMMTQTAESAAPTEEPAPTAEATEPPSQTAAQTRVEPASGVLPEVLGFSYKVMYDGEEQASWQSPTDIKFEGAYAGAEGILTFAGGSLRDSFAFGSPDVNDESLTTLWSLPVGSLEMDGVSGSGVGYAGQPIVVKWSDDVKQTLGVYEKFKSAPGFTEVICPAMDGKVYFAELLTGEQTRQPVDLGVIVKGAAALDPRGYPLLYVGQGVTSAEEGYTGAWLRVIDLIENKVVYKFGGRDPFSPRAAQAYNASPLINADTDTLIVPGENGVIYFVHMNTVFSAEEGRVTVTPDPLLKYKYSGEGYSSDDAPGTRRYGFGSSCACWRNFLFITDNGGRLQCIDMNTLQLKYVLDVTDDSDATAVIEEDATDGCVYLYTANGVIRQQAGADGAGRTYHRKFNALTGELVWEHELPAPFGSEELPGGTLATPHVGRGEIERLVIYSVASALVQYPDGDGRTAEGPGGLMIAYDKRTGEEVWRYTQRQGFVSSPAAVYASNGRAYIVQADMGGRVTLFGAKEGSVLSYVDLGSAVECTPAVFNDIIVLGARGGAGGAAAVFGVRLG